LDDRADQVRGWISAVDLIRPPVFCDREEFFAAFLQLFSAGEEREREHGVLAVSIDGGAQGLGSTRLLQELAIHAFRDGHLPILITTRSPGECPPRSIEQLADQVSRAIFNLRIALELPPRPETQVGLLGRGLDRTPPPGLRRDVYV